MKYNYLERYNLNNIIKEAVGVNFSSFKDIENTEEVVRSGILNTINFEDISNISQNDFEDILSTKKIIEKFDKDYNVVQYFFFYNKRLFMVLLSKDISSGVVSIDFKSTDQLSYLTKNDFNEFKDTFINKNLSFTFERIAHEDSKNFWKYIILCLKIYVKKYNDNYFNFVGSQISVASRAKIKQTNYILIKKILDDFETLLYSNLQKIKDENIGISKEKLDDIFFNFRKHYIEYFNMYYNIFKGINDEYIKQLATYEDKAIKTKVDDFLILKQQIDEDLKQIKYIIRSEKSNIKERKQLDKAIINLDSFYKKWANFIELLESKKFPNQFNFKDSMVNSLESKLLDFGNLISFVILFRSYLVLSNLKTKFNEKKQIKSLEYINKTNLIFNLLVKKYNFKQKTFWEMQSEFFDAIKEEIIELQKRSFYSKEQIKQAIDESLKTMIKSTDNLEFEENYESKLHTLINLNFKSEPVLQTHIQNFLNDSLIFFKSSIEDSNFEKKIGNLIKFNEKGIQSFLNSREKLYYRALESYSKTEPNLIDILYNGSMLFFRIN